MHESNATAKGPEHVCAMELQKCLSVGMDVFLDPNPGHHNSKRYQAKVRGWETGRYMILGLAADASVPAVRNGKACVIRFMHEGEVWGFTAIFAEHVASGDYPLVQLYWPTEVARVQVRKHERVVIQTPCVVRLDGGASIQATISDLSGGGCSLLLDKEVAVGATLRLSFRMPDGGKVNERPVIVRNRKAVPGQGMKYGCQFQAAEDKDHGIELFVARKIAVDRGESAPHPQILVLSRNESDVEAAQQALAGSPYEVVEAAGILDLGYRLRTCAASAILISFEQKELSAIEVLPLIRQSPGLEEIPLFMYGGSSLHDQAVSMGATICLHDLSETGQILAHLPAAANPEANAAPAPAPAPAAPSGGEHGGVDAAVEGAPGGGDVASEPDDDEIQLED